MERVVDQTVDPKIFTDIEPTVESAVSKVLGMDKPCGNKHSRLPNNEKVLSIFLLLIKYYVVKKFSQTDTR